MAMKILLYQTLTQGIHCVRVWHCVESLPTRDWKVDLALAAQLKGVHTSRRESTSPRTLGPGGPPVLGRLDRGVQT